MSVFDDALAAARTLVDGHVSQLEGEIDDLTVALRDARSTVTAHEAHIVAIEANLAERDARVDELESALTTSTSARVALEEALAACREAARVAAAQVAAQERNIAALQARIAELEASTEPGPTNTGVPAGTTLKVHDGDFTVTAAGAVVEGLDIRGYLRIKAPNVTVRRCRVRGRAGLTGSMALVQNGGNAGVVIEDTELVAEFPTYYVDGFVGNNTTLRRVNIHGVVDSVKITGDDVTVEDSWLHDNLYFAEVPSGGDTHNDNVQIGIGARITLRRNVMTGTRNAAVMVTQDRGPVVDLVIEDNHRLEAGACTINIAEKTYGPLKGLRIVGNRFGRGQGRAGCAINAPLSTSSIATIADNTWADDGARVAVTRG